MAQPSSHNIPIKLRRLLPSHSSRMLSASLDASPNNSARPGTPKARGSIVPAASPRRPSLGSEQSVASERVSSSVRPSIGPGTNSRRVSMTAHAAGSLYMPLEKPGKFLQHRPVLAMVANTPGLDTDSLNRLRAVAGPVSLSRQASADSFWYVGGPGNDGKSSNDLYLKRYIGIRKHGVPELPLNVQSSTATEKGEEAGVKWERTTWQDKGTNMQHHWMTGETMIPGFFKKGRSGLVATKEAIRLEKRHYTGL